MSVDDGDQVPTGQTAGWRRRWLRLPIAALVAAVALLTTLAWLQPSDPDDLYRPPTGFEMAAPGTLLRAEPFELGLPPEVEGWRVLYRSTDHTGSPIAVSGLVLAPTTARQGPPPLVAIAHGSTGVAEECAPSLAARPLAPLPGVQEALDAGFVVTATDLPGLGTPGPHPYLVGSTSAHAVLDSLRAARELTTVDPDRTAVWGFSQGGHAALFAGEVAPDYAPELTLDGVVAFAPATELAMILERSQGTVLGTLVLVNAAVSWSEIYDDLDLEDVVAPDAVPAAQELAGRCLDPASLPAATLGAIQLRDDLLPMEGTEGGTWARALEENTPRGPMPTPLLVLQGGADPIIDADITATNVAARCAAGDDVDLRILTGAEHLTISWRGAAQAVTWTQERFDGVATSPTC